MQRLIALFFFMVTSPALAGVLPDLYTPAAESWESTVLKQLEGFEVKYGMFREVAWGQPKSLWVVANRPENIVGNDAVGSNICRYAKDAGAHYGDLIIITVWSPAGKIVGKLNCTVGGG